MEEKIKKELKNIENWRPKYSDIAHKLGISTSTLFDKIKRIKPYNVYRIVDDSKITISSDLVLEVEE